MNDLIIVKVGKAKALLAEARDASDAKKVADLARAAEIYARRQHLSDEAIASATAVKVDALALMGELMEQAPKNTGTAGNGRPKIGGANNAPPKKQPPSYKDSGIGDKHDATAARTCKKLKHNYPDLFAQVQSGKLSPSKAMAQAKKREKRKQRKAQESRNGSVPKSSDWQIICEDCPTGIKNVLPGSVRLVFADPPYNIGINYGSGAKADKLPPTEYHEWCRKWIHALLGCLSSDGSFWLLINDENAAELKIIAEKEGFFLRQWLIWYETFGVNRANGFNRTHRQLFWFVKDPKKFFFDEDAVRRPSDRQAKYNDKRADPEGKTWDDVWGINPPIPRLTGTCKERIEDFPTQLPLALLRPIVACASEPGDLVLDPFCGSGTTGEAAIESGRKFAGIEKNKKFVEAAHSRLQQVKGVIHAAHSESGT
jgi:site-specific DNA-methyltransferase (adenine-specific)